MKISEAKMVILGLFPRNMLLLGCTSAITGFDVLSTILLFTDGETRLLICTKKMFEKHSWKSSILSKRAGH